MRSRKYRIVTAVERLNNRLTRFALRKGIAPPAFALLETTGRRTGIPRHTPVGNGCIGDTFWPVPRTELRRTTFATCRSCRAGP